jgi:RNA polymerase sigma-70 factor (ECF subfamily)
MNQASFRAFYQRTSPALVAYLSSLTGNRAAAEELMQECYLRMLKANLPESMDDHHLRNYMFRIGANLAKDRFRLMRRQGEMPEVDPAVEDSSKRLEFRDLVESAFIHLRREDRQLLWLAYVEEMSHKEISSVTGYTAGSVRPLLSQAKRRFAAVVRSILRMDEDAKSNL